MYGFERGIHENGVAVAVMVGEAQSEYTALLGLGKKIPDHAKIK